MTAFAQALGVLFTDPNLSTPALYQQAGIGPEVAIRVMRRSPDRMVEFGAARLVSDSVVLDVRISDCPELAAGDRFEISAEIFCCPRHAATRPRAAGVDSRAAALLA